MAGREHLRTLNERLRVVFPGRWCLKFSQLETEKESWRVREEEQDQVLVQISYLPTAPRPVLHHEDTRKKEKSGLSRGISLQGGITGRVW